MCPDFSKKTVETIAKRAAYLCSNPDCRISTVGPNSDRTKSTSIGEAAHIYGARPKSKRYLANMTNTARSEITNAIWLCRNCHKLIDSDVQDFSSEVLFAWREQHERYILSELGSKGDKIKLEQKDLVLSPFGEYPPLIRRIVWDRPLGWEFRLTSELMRYLNEPIFGKIDDLQNGLYTKPFDYIEDEQILEWIQNKLNEASRLITPIVKLVERLNKSWGSPGEEGNMKEILHICNLINDCLKRMLFFEEQVHFVVVPLRYEKVVDLLKNLMATQAEKLKIIPNKLDKIIEYIDADNKEALNRIDGKEQVILFEVPEGWEKNFNKELRRAQNLSFINESQSNGCLSVFMLIAAIISLIYFL